MGKNVLRHTGIYKDIFSFFIFPKNITSQEAIFLGEKTK